MLMGARMGAIRRVAERRAVVAALAPLRDAWRVSDEEPRLAAWRHMIDGANADT